MNHLRCLDDGAELVLDSNTIVTSVDVQPEGDKEPAGSRMLDLAEFRCKLILKMRTERFKWNMRGRGRV